MLDEHGPRKLFSETEIGRILKRATELQGAEGPAETTGLSLEEVRQLAMEMGIDPRHVEAAVFEVTQDGDAEKRFHWLGGPTSLERERVVGGEITEQQWEAMVEEIRASFGLVGGAGRVGRAYEWTHDSKDQQAQVTVTSHGGKTRIRVFAHYPNTAALTFMTSTILAMVTAGLLGAYVAPSAFLNFWTFLISLLVAFTLGARFLFGRMMRKKEREAHGLLARLEQIVAEPSEAPPHALPEPTARLDASLLDEAAPEEAPVPTPSRSRTSS